MIATVTRISTTGRAIPSSVSRHTLEDMSRMKSVHRLVGAVLLAASITAAALPVAAQDVPTSTDLDSTAWTLATITRDGAATSVTTEAGATLDFVADRAGGSVGCDRYAAPFTTEAAKLSFGAIESTRTLCDEDTVAWTMSYLDALSSVADFASVDGTLRLLDGAGVEVLTFEAAPMPGVEGSWSVSGIFDGSAMVAPVGDIQPSLAFLPDGRVQGHGGCNGFGGPYAVNGSDIAIGPLMSGIASCDAELDAQEVALLESLRQAFTWDIADGVLELRDSSDIVVVAAGPTLGSGHAVR
jgi:heat shock protein HslJ